MLTQSHGLKLYVSWLKFVKCPIFRKKSLCWMVATGRHYQLKPNATWIKSRWAIDASSKCFLFRSNVIVTILFIIVIMIMVIFIVINIIITMVLITDDEILAANKWISGGGESKRCGWSFLGSKGVRLAGVFCIYYIIRICICIFIWTKCGWQVMFLYLQNNLVIQVEQLL